MRLREIPIAFFAGLAGMALVSWWLAELLTPPPEIAKPVKDHSIDYYALRFTRTEMKVDGTPKSRLSSERMGHYVDDNSSELTKPVMLFFNEDAPPWVVNSDTGAISGDGKTILLNGKATLNREAYGNTHPILVISKNVTVHMDKKFLESDEFTEIYNPPNYTSGTGMRTEFSNGMKVTLSSNVRGRYEF